MPFERKIEASALNLLNAAPSFLKLSSKTFLVDSLSVLCCTWLGRPCSLRIV